MTTAVSDLAEQVGIKRAFALLAYPRGRYCRQRQPVATTRSLPEPPPTAPPVTLPRALSASEREVVREVLNSERFVDNSPRQVYATLLDEEAYLCFISIMYRLLHDHDEVRERRQQKRHPAYVKPELVATVPNQVWTWDITNASASLSTSLRGPATYVYYISLHHPRPF